MTTSPKYPSRPAAEVDPTGEFERAQAEAAGVEKEHQEFRLQNDREWRAKLAALKAENERLRAALEWYGEQARLARLIHSEGDAGRHALANDGGLIARAALGEKP